jgi:hypothetical protein
VSVSGILSRINAAVITTKSILRRRKPKGKVRYLSKKCNFRLILLEIPNEYKIKKRVPITGDWKKCRLTTSIRRLKRQIKKFN